MNLASEFKSLLQNDKDGTFEIAYRPLFRVQFTFQHDPKFLRKSDFKLTYIPFLVHSVDLPNFQIDSEGGVEIKNFNGVTKGPGNVTIVPESNDLTIEFLDTQRSIFERFFIPWINETLKVKNSERSQYPFSRAKVYVDLIDNLQTKVTSTYIVSGVYPNRVESPSLSQDPSGSKIIRSVNFEFNKIRNENTERSLS